MKILFLTISLLSLYSSFTSANDRGILDDLMSLELRVKKNELVVDVHYPNYRMGGGTPPTRRVQDCLILDIIDSDHNLTLKFKHNLASKISVLQGFRGIEEMEEILPEIKDYKVVFKTNGHTLYMTSFGVQAKDGRELKEVLDEIMPPTREGNYPSMVNLLYVRGCRL